MSYDRLIWRAEAYAEAAANLQVAGLNYDAEKLYLKAVDIYRSIGDVERAARCEQYADECCQADQPDGTPHGHSTIRRP